MSKNISKARIECHKAPWPCQNIYVLTYDRLASSTSDKNVLFVLNKHDVDPMTRYKHGHLTFSKIAAGRHLGCDWSSFDIDKFRSDLMNSELVINPPDNCDEFFATYDHTLKSLLDDSAPLIQFAGNRRRAPWYTAQCRDIKAKLRLVDWRKFIVGNVLRKPRLLGVGSLRCSALYFSKCTPSTGQQLFERVLIVSHSGAG